MAVFSGEPRPSRLVLRQAIADAATDGAAVSGNGRYVAVVSLAALLPADTNALHDIYVVDRERHTITLETMGTDRSPANGGSAHPRLSADGRFLVFESLATNLTASPDLNPKQDVFLRDRTEGVTRCVSEGAQGQGADSVSETPVVSDDGRVVVFVSSATNLVEAPDDNGHSPDVYRLDVMNRRIERVGIDDNTKQYVRSFSPAISGDGRLVTFAATERGVHAASNPSVPAPVATTIHVRDLAAARTTCVSCAAEAEIRASSAFTPHMSADGRFVAFGLQVSQQPQTHIALHDLRTSQTTIVTRHANARSAFPSVSADGRFVVFESWASNLKCQRQCLPDVADDNLLPDIYLFDRLQQSFRRVSGERQIWWAPSRSARIDGEGRIVTFTSRQPFGPEDTTVDFDLFVCAPACE
jgi:Tol biopolymer transport system component